MELNRALSCVAVATVMSWAWPLAAAEIVDSFDVPIGNQPDLTFPDHPTDFVGAGGENRMFKPDGAGPFPGLVLLPTCSGHATFLNTFDWARRALAHGYAVMVVDPLTPRKVQSNCIPPLAVTPRRILKDGLDAAGVLRKQPFVDPNHVGLMGFSLGAMASLGAAGSKHAQEGGHKPVQAIVALYPVCKVSNVPLPTTHQLAEIHYIPTQVAVPLLVEMGDLDTEGPARDCIPTLDALKAAGAPVDYRLYHATHMWDAQETRTRPFRKTGPGGVSIVYEYNGDVTEQSARDAFAFLDAHLKGK